MARRSVNGVSGSNRSAEPIQGATIRDVARLAGVSVGTVSRVLNLHPTVRPATRQKVLATMAHLRYEPSQIARSLSLKRTLSIAVVVPFITTASVVERLRGTMDAIEDTEYDLIIYNVETVRGRQRYFRSLPRRERVDGVIVFSLALTAEEESDFLAAGMPVVLVDALSTRLPCVVVDDMAGGHMSTSHLIELGHRRIGFVGDEYPNRFGFGFHNLREQGYVRALQQAGLPTDPDLIATGLFGREEARESALRLLRRPDPPTAIVAASDTQAIGVLAAARDCGLDVPRQLSVVGYDDIEIATYLGLTTINQSLYESGREGARLLLDSLEAVGGPPRTPARRVLPLRLSLRHTTAPPPVTGSV